MMTRINILLLILIFLVSNSCVEEYWPEIDDYQNALVVEGMITNMPPPYTIKLSLTTQFNNPNYIAYQDCNVKITDEEGNVEILTETDDGIYQSAVDGMRGEVGKRYKLSIETPEGKKYESTYEKIATPVGIESVQVILENHDEPETYQDEIGYQFYISTFESEEDTCYFWWQLEETYEYNSEFTIEYVWEGYIREFENWDTLYTCWRTETVPEIFLASSENLANPFVTDFPLHYVNTNSRKLSVRYSLLVNQLMISREAFKFWDNIKSQISEEGLLYTKQPFQVRGNISNISNELEPVLGYFFAAGNTQQRYFVDRPPGIPFYFSECQPNFDLRGLYFTPASRWPLYLTEIDGRLALGHKVCFDCTLRGGFTDMPDFWEY